MDESEHHSCSQIQTKTSLLEKPEGEDKKLTMMGTRRVPSSPGITCRAVFELVLVWDRDRWEQ